MGHEQIQTPVNVYRHVILADREGRSGETGVLA
jgi:hypothetical protein